MGPRSSIAVTTIMAAASVGSTVSGISKSSSVQKLLSSIIVERKREKRIDDGFVVVNSSQAMWAATFKTYFVESKHETDDSRDDLLFYVREAISSSEQAGTDSHNTKERAQHTVDVFRKHSPNLPSPGSADVNWEESVYLNLILQQFEYTLTCAVCTRTGESELQILKKSSQKVYASPSHRQMDSKGTEEVMTYPDIFFCVDNFDEAFGDIVVRDSEMVCVELVAGDRHGNVHGVIFLGSVRYEALKAVYDNRNSLSAKMKGSLSWMITARNGPTTPGGSRKQRLEFIKMRGPHSKGYAEMAVGRQCGASEETPLPTPSSTPAGTPDSEWAPSLDVSTEQPASPDGAEAAGGVAGIGRRASSQSSTDLGSLLRNGLRRGLTMKKSQSLSSDAEGQLKAGEEVEAKSISDELQSKPYSGFLGKSFGQAWHWFKEQRRVASVSLNAHITYVTLPWHRIVEDVLDVRRQPVLAF